VVRYHGDPRQETAVYNRTVEMSERKRILVVDDEARVLFVLRHTLARVGDQYEVETASSGREALRKIREKDFDLVLTDLRMPDIDGIELSRAVREHSPHAAIIWMTAFGSYSAAAEAEELGVDGCLDKPVKIDRIREAVRDTLERHQQQVGPAQERSPEMLAPANGERGKG
jgi:DNA-binding NtrC family response regulator